MTANNSAASARKGRGDGQINFTAYTRAMIDEQAQNVVHAGENGPSSLFTKKPLLQISKLRLSL